MGVANISGNILTDSGTNLSSLVSGSGTTNYVSKWTASGVINNSVLYDNGTNVGLGTISPNIGGYGANSRLLTIQGVSGSYGILELTSNSANADGSAIGRLDFGSDGQAANYKAISSIASFLSGSTSTKFGADLRFYTRVDNAASGDPSERMRINSNGIINIYSDFQLPTGNYIQWLAYSDANSRTWALRNNETEVGDFAISSSTNNSNTLSTVRFRINRSGQIGIGQPSFAGSELVSIKAPSGDYGMRIYAPNSTNNCFGLWVDGGSSSTDNALLIRNQSGSTTYFQVRGDGNTRSNSAVFNNTTSGTSRTVYIGNGDYFLGGVSSIRESKKNIQEFSSEWIYDLKPVQFNYRKKDKEGNYTEEIYEEINYGLIAEDTAPIADFLINYNEKEDGSKEMIGIEYMRLITPMLKSIQEQKKLIDELSAKVTALENK